MTVEEGVDTFPPSGPRLGRKKEGLEYIYSTAITFAFFFSVGITGEISSGPPRLDKKNEFLEWIIPFTSFIFLGINELKKIPVPTK